MDAARDVQRTSTRHRGVASQRRRLGDAADLRRRPAGRGRRRGDERRRRDPVAATLCPGARTIARSGVDRALADRDVARRWRASRRTASAANQYRDALAAGGGSAFYIGWGVHGGNNPRTEMISTKPAGAACGAARDADADRDRLGHRGPDGLTRSDPTTRLPRPDHPTPGPSAINDFTTLPAASKCVRNRKLTVRMKRPPKGYTVKTVTVKVNNKRVATLKAKRSRSRCTCASCRRGRSPSRSRSR